jgi:hypothetical protein
MRLSDDMFVRQCDHCATRLIGLTFCPRCGSRDTHAVEPTVAESAVYGMMMQAMSPSASYRAICVNCGVTFQTNYLTNCPHCGEVLDAEPYPDGEGKPDLSQFMDGPGRNDVPMGRSWQDYDDIIRRKKLEIEREIIHGGRMDTVKPMSRKTFDRLWTGEWPT